MPESDFSAAQNLEGTANPTKLKRLSQKLNRLRALLKRETHKMKHQHNAYRKRRTRLLIQAGGQLQKSGILDAFHISPGDDLQDYEIRPKSLQLLGFLTTCFENNTFDEENLERWRKIGERRV